MMNKYIKVAKRRTRKVVALPLPVVREAVTNAIGHRDYIDPNGVLIEVFDDRLQITNPGGLLPGQTLRKLAETPRHRNPIIHRLINDCGWGEGLSFGIKLMYKQQRENNSPDPEFKDHGGMFRLTLYTLRAEKKRKPIDYVSEHTKKDLEILKTPKYILN